MAMLNNQRVIILPVLMFADTDLWPQGSDIESDEDEDMEDDDTGPPQDRATRVSQVEDVVSVGS